MAAQERDRLALDVLAEGEILRVSEREVVVLDQLARVLGALEIESVPIDDGRTGQDEPEGLDVVKRELGEALERSTRQGPDGRRRRGVARRGQWCVVVALPSPGRRSERVPKKMPSVTPRTAS